MQLQHELVLEELCPQSRDQVLLLCSITLLCTIASMKAEVAIKDITARNQTQSL